MRNVIITVHGIRTNKMDKNWQDGFKFWVNKEHPSIIILKFKYGFLHGIMSWYMAFAKTVGIPGWFRGYYIKKLSNFIKEGLNSHPNAKVSIVAHSFGGWLTECAINKLEDVKLYSVIFVHCPIAAHAEDGYIFSWLKKGRVKHIHSWSSHEDEVIGLIAIPPFGQNGYWGYIRYNDAQDRLTPSPKPYNPYNIYNTHSEEEHNGVLTQPKTYGPLLVNQASQE